MIKTNIESGLYKYYQKLEISTDNSDYRVAYNINSQGLFYYEKPILIYKNSFVQVYELDKDNYPITEKQLQIGFYISSKSLSSDIVSVGEKFLKSYSRYSGIRKLKDSSGITLLDSYEPLNIPITEYDTYTVIDFDTENRLDILSNRVYGTWKLWWVLAQVNEIDDPFVVERGRVMRIPDLNTLTRLEII